MPCLIRLLTPDAMQPAPYSADSLAEAARHEPHDGVYTVANTFDTFKVLKLDAHLDRLEDSARREQIALTLDRARLRAALRQMISEAGYGDVRFRITVGREQPEVFILSIEPFAAYPASLFNEGVRCQTLPNSARHNPSAKSTGWMHDREQITLGPGIYTGLLLDESGQILEGINSNFYAILDGRLRTAGEGVLPGIAQQIVFTVAPSIVALERQPVCISDLPRLSETFITSSSRGIMPVVEIDGIQIGTGKPGAITQALRAAYQAWVSAHLESL
jgi:branched-chain amino acid aminotransferase